MTAIAFLPLIPTTQIIIDVKKTLQDFPHVYRTCPVKDGIYLFLESNDELFRRKKAEELAKLSAREELNNPSKRIINMSENGNPYIKDERRKKLDPFLDPLIKEINPDKAPEEISYIILKLLVKGLPIDVRGGILAQGVMTETLKNYQEFIFMPLEKRILLQRWLEPDGSWQ